MFSLFSSNSCCEENPTATSFACRPLSSSFHLSACCRRPKMRRPTPRRLPRPSRPMSGERRERGACLCPFALSAGAIVEIENNKSTNPSRIEAAVPCGAGMQEQQIDGRWVIWKINNDCCRHRLLRRDRGRALRPRTELAATLKIVTNVVSRPAETQEYFVRSCSAFPKLMFGSPHPTLCGLLDGH